ncbi:hypothetical protein ABK040_007680 [Willaertia magna]
MGICLSSGVNAATVDPSTHKVLSGRKTNASTHFSATSDGRNKFSNRSMSQLSVEDAKATKEGGDEKKEEVSSLVQNTPNNSNDNEEKRVKPTTTNNLMKQAINNSIQQNEANNLPKIEVTGRRLSNANLKNPIPEQQGDKFIGIQKWLNECLIDEDAPNPIQLIGGSIVHNFDAKDSPEEDKPVKRSHSMIAQRPNKL